MLALGLVQAAHAAGPAGTATADPRFSAERCAGLVALFDAIVQSRFDHRLLQIDPEALADARRWRLQAEADCAAGQLWFGVHLIEDALREIGVVPPRSERRDPGGAAAGGR